MAFRPHLSMGLAFKHGLEDLLTELKPFHQEQGLHILRGVSIGRTSWLEVNGLEGNTLFMKEETYRFVKKNGLTDTSDF